ncbi:cobalt-precorrin-6A reductase [Pseudooceanicola sediminis]|uniref:Cobalt-precorrin-6A reductase n=1 Tax=Pseudooceanicola sediminis TaxID=2211117 RepID=A0A399J2V4_9RHOB|nr:cobalt-precorrin-6A reductase [Pseudooceanicola sediminis]KAA2317385.1 cobalt-precorrin-6A reductase [Puniceibacterium sp. HSS470]RII39738.1 cobalt-precorrin-6A reductase [Pseudooceanicola sediminis]|tara:strand:- start:6276 stop:7007 length:732 start_codon:yes stop_codon:yes gene_type:complete
MTILLLGGTAEARVIAGKLAEAGTPAVVSLAGAVRRPAPQPIASRVGGFGGEEGFRTYLACAGIRAVLDATHPFAARITARTARICAEQDLPYALLRRPGWQPGRDDAWTFLADESEVAAHIPVGDHAFLATGRQSLPRYANMAGRRMTLRVIDPPDQPFPHVDGQYLVGRPPFAQSAEEALFRDLGVDWLVAKNAGGTAGRAKLDAARVLGLPVLLIARPDAPPGVTVLRSVAEAMTWLAVR